MCNTSSFHCLISYCIFASLVLLNTSVTSTKNTICCLSDGTPIRQNQLSERIPLEKAAITRRPQQLSALSLHSFVADKIGKV